MEDFEDGDVYQCLDDEELFMVYDSLFIIEEENGDIYMEMNDCTRVYFYYKDKNKYAKRFIPFGN